MGTEASESELEMGSFILYGAIRVQPTLNRIRTRRKTVMSHH